MTAVTDGKPRANHLGDPCPPFCAIDHAALTPAGKRRAWHASRRADFPDAAGTPGAATLELFRSGAGPSRPRLDVGASNAEVYSLLRVLSAEDAFALSVLVEAAGAMDEAGRAALSQALRDASLQLPLDAEL